MITDNKSIVLAESSKFVKQIGNRVVLSLYARIREIEALTRALGTTVENLPKSVDGYTAVVPQLLNFQDDLAVAGGGVWPEPFAFSPDCDRHSFFWGRGPSGTLHYFDDYNQSGYHHESWYVVGRYLKPGQCFWSKSYVDLHSGQAVVTCTTPIFSEGEFAGVVTVDLKLEGLQAQVEQWQKKTGGYVFILDRNNTFITFPDLPLVQRLVWGTEEQRSTLEFLQAEELSAQEPLFTPIAIALNGMNQAILQQAQATTHYSTAIATALSQDSEQISAAEAALISAILVDPLGGDVATSHLREQFQISDDFLLHEACTVFLFHVPHTYWKVVVVKPFSEAAIATYGVIQSERMSSIGQVVAGVVHEVNNPISFISGNLAYANTYVRDLIELVRLYQRHYPEVPADIDKHLKACDFEFLINDLPKILTSMKVGANRIRQIVLSLRNFARMDESKVKTINLHESIDSTLLLLESRLKQRDERDIIYIVREYGNLPLIDCYPGPLNQVFMNILVNAVDAMEEAIAHGKVLSDGVSPSIHISTRMVDDDKVLICIADNGPGIPEEIRQKLFEPFFTTKPVGKGTGLGLAICQQIITEKHQGRLWCESTLGRGTSFWIELPIAKLDTMGDSHP
ncbi:MAG TPA: ATP-binding protein [Chroococcidiopsis sp.]